MIGHLYDGYTNPSNSNIMDEYYSNILDKTISESMLTYTDKPKLIAGTIKENHIDKYLKIKDLYYYKLPCEADKYERNVLKHFVNKAGKIIMIKRNNYVLKSMLGIIAFNSLINWIGAINENKLRRIDSYPSTKNLVCSSLLFFGGLTLL